jgi:branched-chain amino acid aminotransferase
MVVSINGKIVDEKHACLPVTSDALLYGFCVFETIRTYNKKVFRLNDHLARLYVSADVIGMKSAWTFKKTYQAVVEALEKSPYNEAKIRVILGRKELIIIISKHLAKPVAYYRNGISLVTYLGKRNTPRAKILSDTFCYLAKQHAKRCGAVEALLVDPNSYVRECAYSNIFWVDGSELHTTNKDILYGITRDTVIELAEKCHFEPIKYKSLIRMDEIFITQTSGGILPVVEIDGHKIGTGKLGPMTKKLMEAFDRLVWGQT